MSLFLFLSPVLAAAQVLTGADVLVSSRLDLLSGKRVGIVTNQTGRLRTGEYLVDALIAHGIHVTALFGPEHGIRGEAGAGEHVNDTIDERTHIRVYSLYGTTSKPTARMLDSVDVLIYDIQDVGVRYYTFISTMYLVMQAAAEHHIPMIVLDRPDPLGGVVVDGPVLEDSLRSFVGMMPIPVVYGLTCGELARMINGEGWLKGGVHADLTVVPMEGWKRAMSWDKTGVPWIAPSPNIPDVEACLAYPVTCFLEATNFSEGRGTQEPFLTIGAPFVKADTLADVLQRSIRDIRWDPVDFTPKSSKHAGTLCHGVRLHIGTGPLPMPVSEAVMLLRILKAMYPDSLKIREGWLLKLSGSTLVPACLENEATFLEAQRIWRSACDHFTLSSAPYRLYR